MATKKKEQEKPKDQKVEETEVEEKEQEQSEQESSSSAETEKPEIMIPKSRFDEVNSELKKLRDAETAARNATRQAEEQRLKEKEDYKALADKHEKELAGLRPKAELLEEYEQSLRGLLESQIAELPEQYRELVPSELPIAKQLNWLAANKAKLMKSTAPDLGAGKRGAENGKKVELTAEEQQVAKKFGYTDEEYAKYKEQTIVETK